MAGEGASSQNSALTGSTGRDCEITAPDGKANVIGGLNNDRDRILVAEGGLGGKLLTSILSLKGQNQIIHLDLKLTADVRLVGFPNAGKSSLLSQISHAKPATMDYAFTTVKPELGKMYKDFKQVTVADLPGLMEGAPISTGMGHAFLKHIERTKLLLLFLSIFLDFSFHP